ncbi:hypothetical protein GCM10007338_16690 [Corynebacterium pelargi]|nr:hypothetical protein GCM10007338_16690 [Corynebacterium pelargi]
MESLIAARAVGRKRRPKVLYMYDYNPKPFEGATPEAQRPIRLPAIFMARN